MCIPKTIRKCTSIWVIVDQLNKLAFFILMRMDYNAAKLTKTYAKMVISLHEYLVSIILNRGTKVTSNF